MATSQSCKASVGPPSTLTRMQHRASLHAKCSEQEEILGGDESRSPNAQSKVKHHEPCLPGASSGCLTAPLSLITIRRRLEHEWEHHR
jgi:hypothetical protein